MCSEVFNFNLPVTFETTCRWCSTWSLYVRAIFVQLISNFSSCFKWIVWVVWHVRTKAMRSLLINSPTGFLRFLAVFSFFTKNTKKKQQLRRKFTYQSSVDDHLQFLSSIDKIISQVTLAVYCRELITLTESMLILGDIHGSKQMRNVFFFTSSGTRDGISSSIVNLCQPLLSRSDSRVMQLFFVCKIKCRLWTISRVNVKFAKKKVNWNLRERINRHGRDTESARK